MKNIFVTGASGFIGQALCRRLLKLNFNVTGTYRNSKLVIKNSKFKKFFIDEINMQTTWKQALNKIDCIIHCAGKSHVMNDKENVEIYDQINTWGTKKLALDAVEAGVKRLIFLSTIKVNGESQNQKNNHKIFKNTDTPNPQDKYSLSKFRAENLLREIALKTKLEIIIVRLPLVYGYNVQGNLKRLMQLVDLKIPLPFSLIKNKRSLVSIDNLIDLLIRCIDHPKASGQTFLISDGEDLSTKDLLRYIAIEKGYKIHFFPFPLSLLKFFCFIIGKSKEISRFTSSLQVDIENTKELLDWKPILSVKDGIRRMVKNK